MSTEFFYLRHKLNDRKTKRGHPFAVVAFKFEKDENTIRIAKARCAFDDKFKYSVARQIVEARLENDFSKWDYNTVPMEELNTLSLWMLFREDVENAHRNSIYLKHVLTDNVRRFDTFINILKSVFEEEANK